MMSAKPGWFPVVALGLLVVLAGLSLPWQAQAEEEVRALPYQQFLFLLATDTATGVKFWHYSAQRSEVCWETSGRHYIYGEVPSQVALRDDKQARAFVLKAGQLAWKRCKSVGPYNVFLIPEGFRTSYRENWTEFQPILVKGVVWSPYDHKPHEQELYEPSYKNFVAVEGGKTVSGIARLKTRQGGDHVIVDVMLNRGLTVPFILDTGASHTILTIATARALEITTRPDQLSMTVFRTAGGPTLAVVTTLKSLRVGTAEVQDVEVAIPIKSDLPMDLLGMTFLRHFRVTVDRERGYVTFERYREPSK